MDGWIMVGIMVFVIIAQGVLWAWVILERRRVIPDVKIMNMRELIDAARVSIDEHYRRLTTKSRAR